MEYIIHSFFSRKVENDISEKLFYRDYKIEDGLMYSYVEQLLTTPLSYFIEYVLENCSTSFIIYQDIVQFSSFKDATENLCFALSSKDNNGQTNIEVGRLLLDDGKERKDGALRKYGENHAKTALELGLVQENCGNYYLTSIGEIFNNLSTNDKNELLRRTLLRNRFFQRLLIKGKCEKITIRGEMSFLSESTIIRRLPNIKLLYFMLKGVETQLNHYFKNISIQ